MVITGTVFVKNKEILNKGLCAVFKQLNLIMKL
jgi:hypothetical protein